MDKHLKQRKYWTIENCREEAAKYKRMNHFKKKNPLVYDVSFKNGWLKEISSHMDQQQNIDSKPKGFWTKTRCAMEASKYGRRSDFQKNSLSGYHAAREAGWLDEVCAHMGEYTRKGRGYWTKENCHVEALKYDTRTKFLNECFSAYRAAQKGKWLDEICSHMKEVMKPSGYWTKERCTEEAKKYETRYAFQSQAQSAYHAARKFGWLDQICLHMGCMGKRKKKRKRGQVENAQEQNETQEFKRQVLTQIEMKEVQQLQDIERDALQIEKMQQEAIRLEEMRLDEIPLEEIHLDEMQQNELEELLGEQLGEQLAAMI